MRDPQALKELKEILGHKANFVQFLAMIQDQEVKNVLLWNFFLESIIKGINNLDNILDEVDGIIWARSYLAVHIPIEKVI